MPTSITTNNVQTGAHQNPPPGAHTGIASYAIPAGSDQVLFLATAIEDSSTPPTPWNGVTFGGVAMTELGPAGGYIHTGGVNRLQLWELTAPSGTGDIVLTPGGSMEFGAMTAFTLNGVDTAVARVVTNGNEASTATSISTNITPTIVDSILLAATCLGASNLHTPGAGVTELSDLQDGGSNMQHATGWKEGGDLTQKALAWTFATTNRAIQMAVAYAPKIAPVGTYNPMLLAS